MAAAKKPGGGTNRSTGSSTSRKKATPGYKTLGDAARASGSSPDSSQAQRLSNQWQGKAPKKRSTPSKPRK